jgi:hypothetical protein
VKVTVRGALSAGAAVVIAGLGAAFPTHGWPSTIMVLIPAAVLLVLAVRREPPGPVEATARDRRGLVLWPSLVVAGLAWEAYAFVRQPDWSRADPVHPTLSTLLDPALEHGPLRVVGWALWLVAGWRLVVAR